MYIGFVLRIIPQKHTEPYVICSKQLATNHVMAKVTPTMPCRVNITREFVNKYHEQRGDMYAKTKLLNVYVSQSGYNVVIFSVSMFLTIWILLAHILVKSSDFVIALLLHVIRCVDVSLALSSTARFVKPCWIMHICVRVNTLLVPLI